MASVEHEAPAAGAGDGLFARRATGLVREVSPASAAVYNMATASPGLFAAISAFLAFSVFPRANILVAIALTVPISLLVGVTFSVLQRIVPRSGGDYVIVSRLLSPPVGVASTLLLAAGAIVGMAFFCYSFVSVGLQPALAIIGTVAGSDGLLSLSEDLTRQGWTLLFALLFLLLGLALVSVPMRTTMRVQNICIGIAGAGFVLGLLVLWLVPKGDFVGNFDGYAGAGAYERLDEAGGSASYTVRDTVYAIATIAAFTIYQWWSTYFAGEIKQLSKRSIFTMLAPTLVFFAALFLMVGTLVAKFDHGFLVAASTGDEAYTLAAPPFWQFLASIAGGNTVVAIVLAVTFIFWLPLLAIVQLLPPIRSAFAMAFDGLLPRATAKVDPRTHIPLLAVGAVGLLSLIATLWAVLGNSSFASAALYSATFTNTTMLIMCVAAILLPFRHRELWASSPISGRIAGIPILSLLGAVTFCAVAFTSFLYVQPELGISSPWNAVRNVVVVAAFGVGLYVVASRVQRKRGIDLGRHYQEIPPE